MPRPHAAGNGRDRRRGRRQIEECLRRALEFALLVKLFGAVAFGGGLSSRGSISTQPANSTHAASAQWGSSDDGESRSWTHLGRT